MNAQKSDGFENYNVVTVPSADRAAENFVNACQQAGVSVAVLTDLSSEGFEWEKRHIPTVRCPASDQEKYELPLFPVRAVYLFEDTLRHTCNYLRFAVDRIGAPIYVIARNSRSCRLYRQLGASYVICTHSSDVNFLVPRDEDRSGRITF